MARVELVEHRQSPQGRAVHRDHLSFGIWNSGVSVCIGDHPKLVAFLVVSLSNHQHRGNPKIDEPGIWRPRQALARSSHRFRRSRRSRRWVKSDPRLIKPQDVSPAKMGNTQHLAFGNGASIWRMSLCIQSPPNALGMHFVAQRAPVPTPYLPPIYRFPKPHIVDSSIFQQGATQARKYHWTILGLYFLKGEFPGCLGNQKPSQVQSNLLEPPERA